MMILFLKLLLAHLLGDFVFQPTSWVADKKKKRNGLGLLFIFAPCCSCHSVSNHIAI